MPASHLLQFFLVCLLLALSPGPDNVTVITRSVTQGTRAGIMATLGFASGVIVHTSLAALGVAALIAAFPAAFWSIRIAGALYLLYLAVRIFRSREAFNLEASGDPRGLASVYAQSALMNILNPKVTLFFLAFLPPQVRLDLPMRPWLQIVIFGALFALATILVFGALALFAGPISGFLRHKPAATKPLRLATAGLFLVLAILILIR